MHRILFSPSSRQLLALERARTVRLKEAIDRLRRHLRRRADIEAAVIRDVEQNHLRHSICRRRVAKLGELADLRRRLRVLRSVEEEHLLTRRLRLLVAALKHHAERRLLVNALGTLGTHVDERLRTPREVGALWIVRDAAARIVGDGLARVGVNEDKRRDAADAKALQERLLTLVALRDREPRHRAVILCKLLRRLVRGDKDDLQVLRLEVLLIRVDEHRSELAAWRAPVRGEVQADHLAVALEVRELDRVSVRTREELVAERLPDGWRLPWQVLAGRILRDGLAAVGRDRLAGGAVENHERRDAVHLELLRELGLERAVVEWKREPRLLLEVGVELGRALVAGDEDVLEAGGLEVVRVPLCELRSEAAARRAPVRGEIERD